MYQMLMIRQMRCALRADLDFPWAVTGDPQSRLGGATTVMILKGHLGEMSPRMGTWAFLLIISTTGGKVDLSHCRLFSSSIKGIQLASIIRPFSFMRCLFLCLHVYVHVCVLISKPELL